jgi:hypothetical protein
VDLERSELTGVHSPAPHLVSTKYNGGSGSAVLQKKKKRTSLIKILLLIFQRAPPTYRGVYQDFRDDAAGRQGIELANPDQGESEEDDIG